MKRTLRWITYLISGLVALAGCRQGDPNQDGRAADDRPPNIVFIMADDLGYAEAGCYGQERIETPNIDRLAAGGMRFTQFYSGAPVCAPARCVLLTGKHSGHAYIRGNDEWRERGEVWDFAKAVEDPGLEGQRPVPDSVLTIAELLQSAGYRTACIGKWGLGAPFTEGAPNNQGFDFFFGYNCQRQAHTYYPRHLWRNEEKIWLSNELVVPGTRLEDGADPMEEESYSRYSLTDFTPDLMLDETMRFLEDSRDGPFFLYFATPIPHVPLQAPDSLVRHYREKFGEEKPYLGERGYFPNRYPRATYAAMVTYLDGQVGAIVRKLKEMGAYENTLFFFTSDNGPTYAGGADSEFFDSAAPFSSAEGRGKGSVYEGGIRIPFIAHWPGKVKASTTSDHIGAFYDIFPTLCEIAGIGTSSEIDGISILPVLLGVESQKEHDFLYWEFPEYGGQQAVRIGNWKGIRKDMKEGNMQIELYNLSETPYESRNVADKHPEIVERMEDIMKEQHQVPAVDRFKLEILGDR